MIEQLVKEQRAYFNTNVTKPVKFRKKQLSALKKMLIENQQALFDAIYEDFKKSKFDTYTTELGFIYHDIKTCIKHVDRWSEKTKVSTNLINFPAKSYVIAEPLGVALIIGAWNYPYQLSLAPVVAAISAGNTVILKPSELPANTSKVMAQLVSKYFDPQFFTIVEGGIPETSELLAQKFDKIFFTGSVPVGKIVYEAAAKQLTPVTLELGGKSPAIVTQSCNIKTSAKRLIWSKFLNAGQTCIAPDYMLIHNSIKDQFLEQCVVELEAQKHSFSNDNYVQIINNRNFERLSELIEKEKVFYGGTTNKEERYISPTILNDVAWEDKVMQDEIFGPILPVISYSDLDGAIAKIKSRPKPLALYLYTSDKRTKQKVLNEVSFGGGGINDSVMHITNSNLPFGGVGNSGLGAYHGIAGFKAFSHYKSILDKPTWFESQLKYYPFSDWKLKLIKKLIG